VPISKAFWTGLLADLLNPKMGVFYLAVLPQFIPKDGPVFAWSMALMTIEFIIAVVCLSLYAALASSARRMLTHGKITAWMERILGGVLLGFGARVAIG
jgi:attX protein